MQKIGLLSLFSFISIIALSSALAFFITEYSYRAFIDLSKSGKKWNRTMLFEKGDNQPMCSWCFLIQNSLKVTPRQAYVQKNF